MLRMLPLMIALDADENGEISSGEMEKAAAALKGLDKNHDGKLTEEELRPDFRALRGEGGPGFGGPGFGRPFEGEGGRGPQELIARLMQMDKNNDGKIEKSELPERVQPILERADTDKDGFATKEDFEKLTPSQLADLAGRPEFGRGPGGFGDETRGPGARGPRANDDDDDRDDRREGDREGEPARDGDRDRPRPERRDGGEGESSDRGPDDRGPGPRDGGRGGFGGGIGANVDEFLDRAFEFDKDKDGKLSRDELAAVIRGMRDREEGRNGDRPPRADRN
jgi:Ca2+-binding EF-hand superfamily protein